MKKIQKLSFLLIILSFSNFCASNDKKIMLLNEEIDQLSQRFIVDKSLSFNSTLITKNGQDLEIRGKTTSKDLYNELMIVSDSLNLKFNVLLLPDSSLKDSIYGIVNVSALPMREDPSHLSQMVDQLIMGNTVKILHEKSNWYLIQNHYKYIGWITKPSIYRCTSEGIDSWLTQSKYMVNKVHSMVYSDSNKYSHPVTDLVLNSRLKIDRIASEWAKAHLPDGRIGYVKKSDLKSIQKPIYNTQLIQNILKSAKTMIGVPYLWGGNSSKGNDCSGFTQTVFASVGILIPRDARQQAVLGSNVNKTEAEAGDLFFFGDGEKVRHVAICLGGLEFIHQGSRFEGKVDIHSLDPNSTLYNHYRDSTFMFAKHILSVKGNN